MTSAVALSKPKSAGKRTKTQSKFGKLARKNFSTDDRREKAKSGYESQSSCEETVKKKKAPDIAIVCKRERLGKSGELEGEGEGEGEMGREIAALGYYTGEGFVLY